MTVTIHFYCVERSVENIYGRNRCDCVSLLSSNSISHWYSNCDVLESLIWNCGDTHCTAIISAIKMEFIILFRRLNVFSCTHFVFPAELRILISVQCCEFIGTFAKTLPINARKLSGESSTPFPHRTHVVYIYQLAWRKLCFAMNRPNVINSLIQSKSELSHWINGKFLSVATGLLFTVCCGNW